MLHLLTQLPKRDILRLVEDVRLTLDALEAAAAGIAAGMRVHTMDPDGAYHLLQALHDAMKAKLDALVSALGER